MNHGKPCENGCGPATWSCEHLFFCEACKEEIIENKGIDAYNWARLPVPESHFTDRAGNTARRWPKREFRAKPKPPTKPSKFRKVRPGIIAIPDATNPRHVRWVCKTTAAWEGIRSEVFERDGGRCRRCGRLAPLHNRILTPIDEGFMPSVIRAGNAAHINARRLGGGFRDDHPDNLVWLDEDCHRADPKCTFLQPEEAYATA